MTDTQILAIALIVVSAATLVWAALKAPELLLACVPDYDPTAEE